MSSLGLVGRAGSARIPTCLNTSAGQVVCLRRFFAILSLPPRLLRPLRALPDDRRRLDVEPELERRGLRDTGRSVAGIRRGLGACCGVAGAAGNVGADPVDLRAVLFLRGAGSAAGSLTRDCDAPPSERRVFLRARGLGEGPGVSSAATLARFLRRNDLGCDSAGMA